MTRRMLTVLVAVVSLGVAACATTPDDADSPEAPDERARRALADVLFGVTVPRGTLPVAIPGLHPRGHAVALP